MTGIPKALRILHGPENIAGMASLIASEQRKLGAHAESVCLPSKFDYHPDYWLAQDTPPSVSFSSSLLASCCKPASRDILVPYNGSYL